jgi:hypothetical protein
MQTLVFLKYMRMQRNAPRTRHRLFSLLCIWTAHCWLAIVAYFLIASTIGLATAVILLLLSALSLTAPRRRQIRVKDLGRQRTQPSINASNRQEPSLPIPKNGWPWLNRNKAAGTTTLADRQLDRKVA